MDPLARIRTFPKAPAPNDDISAIRGNVPSEHKQLNANCLAYHIGGAGSKVFANGLLNDMKLVEVNVRQKRPGVGGEAQGTERWECETVCEIEVKEGLCAKPPWS
ncbi:hypothetical protein PHLCEN_2v7448 [Hermanssonia centrifuga]|uniref:Uncharacterized protein n=1 Tax=Hermanssonia centrifuga TaxID=98765 RepID=A0A2R6NWL4_9APHY|nr:hypothetical protein PHLCEN_2v7448 [Hermanssonia centrifuga]